MCLAYPIDFLLDIVDEFGHIEAKRVSYPLQVEGLGIDIVFERHQIIEDLINLLPHHFQFHHLLHMDRHGPFSVLRFHLVEVHFEDTDH